MSINQELFILTIQKVSYRLSRFLSLKYYNRDLRPPNTLSYLKKNIAHPHLTLAAIPWCFISILCESLRKHWIESIDKYFRNEWMFEVYVLNYKHFEPFSSPTTASTSFYSIEEEKIINEWSRYYTSKSLSGILCNRSIITLCPTDTLKCIYRYTNTLLWPNFITLY